MSVQARYAAGLGRASGQAEKLTTHSHLSRRVVNTRNILTQQLGVGDLGPCHDARPDLLTLHLRHSGTRSQIPRQTSNERINSAFFSSRVLRRRGF